MECDCIRDGVVCPKDKPGCAAENFFYTSEPDPKDHTRTNVSFFFEAGWGDDPRPIRGYNFTGCAMNGTCRYDKAVNDEKVKRAFNMSYNFYQPLGDAIERNGSLRQVVPPVDVAIYNRGLWGTLTTKQAQRYMPLFRDMVDQTDGRCFFKSTTGSGRSNKRSVAQEQGVVRNETAKAGCSFFDLGQITSDFGRMPEEIDGEKNLERLTVYSDTVHFRPWVYEEFNNILLNVLCNSDS